AVMSSNSSASRAWKGAVTPVGSAHNEGKTHTSQRGRAGRAATKGARVHRTSRSGRTGTKRCSESGISGGFDALRLVLRTQPRSEKSSRPATILADTDRRCSHVQKFKRVIWRLRPS